MVVHAKYTSSNVPQEFLDMVSLDDSINVDVISMGAMAATGLSDEDAEDQGLIKNHWMWRFIIKEEQSMTGQIQFGFSLTDTPSVASDQAQYARSSDRPFNSNSSGPGTVSVRSLGSDEGARFDDVSSINKPPVALSDSGEHVTGDALNLVNAPSIHSSLGGIIRQPSRGPRVPGTFDIIARSRTDPSWSHRFTRSFRLAPGTTFGQLFRSVISRGMEPFHFQQVGFARFGCRDGISQFAAAWLEDGLLVNGICRERTQTHIYDLLCWRYSRPAVSGELITSDEEAEEGHDKPKSRGFCFSRSDIDRAIWPEGYVHVEHPKLLFTQRPDA